ncbi:hypothetical protein SSS_02845 [Sarcoptes scabiei]|nr:hypothetical protein SSS_02845 [Sarcoptes scabiei]
MIEEDLPAIIDFVLERTNSSTLAYVGHSQGSFIMLGLLSTKPIYSTRIKPFIAISPVFYLTKVDTLLGLFTSSIPGWFLRFLFSIFIFRHHFLFVGITDQMIFFNLLFSEKFQLDFPYFQNSFDSTAAFVRMLCSRNFVF